MTEKRSDYRRRQAEQAEKANRQEAGPGPEDLKGRKAEKKAEFCYPGRVPLDHPGLGDFIEILN
ncbi:hypothetical protein LDE04_01280 [Lactobacillus delbrueckii subsp. lactis]|uniref:hypothetical protein n=1 Tax=Lactobacillus delbrueckii TaxID=1584 RepID=UPI0004A5CBAA|nr:hypothetical protein [Lactobacillus delbrueckii]MCD5443234.1 hypothetical protein [Lactobacillus delbrueckii subsp. lactis]MCD5507677.1 hypothetical protein [Lactobacillus delbrueckii subsp. lactis]MCD5509441.1 hypothetical protein [Lactobacillus delbrueckii subsp. lactis]MCD5511406.1 hypothetical protein [Lactobacillus delbrueckii subsp. lactis]CDR77140.1 Hypothetical protein LBCNRZ327_01135 [Lactobacillus delbrueckii subsp. lactis]